MVVCYRDFMLCTLGIQIRKSKIHLNMDSRAACTTTAELKAAKPVDEIKIWLYSIMISVYFCSLWWVPPYSNEFLIFGFRFLMYIHTYPFEYWYKAEYKSETDNFFYCCSCKNVKINWIHWKMYTIRSENNNVD